MKIKTIPTKVLNNMVIQMGEDDNCVNVTLHKTLRLPDDGKTYGLPPSLGMFRVHKVDDYKDSVPEEWLKTGGIFFCMYQREAMWLKFDHVGNNPKALKIGVGKINAINGKPWKNSLERNDYCVIPDQKWLDGIASSNGKVKQFVAMEMGGGYTVEGQVSGKEEFGGIQLLSYNGKRNIRTTYRERKRPPHHYGGGYGYGGYGGFGGGGFGGGFGGYVPQSGFGLTNAYFNSSNNNNNNNHIKRKKKMVSTSFHSMERNSSLPSKSLPPPQIHQEHFFACDGILANQEEIDDGDDHHGNEEEKEIGLAVGGSMRQKVLADSYGFSNWIQEKCSRIYIRIVNPKMYEKITGEQAECEVTEELYKQYGYPWYAHYDERYKRGIGGKSAVVRGIKTVKQIDKEKKEEERKKNTTWPKEDNNKKSSWPKEDNQVRDGDW